MIQNLIFRALSKYYFGHTIFTRSFIIFKKPRKMTVFPYVPVGISEYFLISDFLTEILKAKKS